MKSVFENKSRFLLQGVRIHGFRGYPPMFHTHAELVYVLRGSLNVTIDGAAHTLQAGQVAAIFPYVSHSYSDAPDADVILLLFSPDVMMFDGTLKTQKPTYPIASADTLAPLLERVVDRLQKGKEKTALSYLNAVIGELLELLSMESSNNAARDMTVQVLQFCSEHFAEKITVKTVADALYISESYVSKIFTGRLHCRFREYLNLLRMDKAKTLLADTDIHILEIMAVCGFTNQSSFNRVFRGICGCSPTEFRSAVWEKKPSGQ